MMYPLVQELAVDAIPVKLTPRANCICSMNSLTEPVVHNEP